MISKLLTVTTFQVRMDQVHSEVGNYLCLWFFVADDLEHIASLIRGDV